MTSQTSVTATPNPSSAFWFDDPAMTVGRVNASHTMVVLSPMNRLAAYLTAQPQMPVAVHVEPLEPFHNVGIVEQVSTAKSINKAREDSGLTWEQLARVFGVSRRAVHMWATGGRMNATNAELLVRFLDLLAQIEGSPDDRRAALIAIDTDGTSALDKFRIAYSSPDGRFASLPRPESLLGVLHGNAARDRVDTCK